MSRFLLRLLSTLILVAAIFTASRALVRALPGDPIETLVAESGTSLPLEKIRAELRLDRPFLPALIEDSRHFLRGDFGISLLSKRPIASLLWIRLARTVELAVLATALALGLSALLGLSAAAFPSGLMDRICTIHGALSAALPLPWLGPVFMITFAVWIPLFPAGGQVFLPAFALALGLSGLWARLIRERVRETLKLNAAIAARARGLSELRVVLKYGLVPCSGALLAYLGSQVGALLGGSFIAEVIFDWKGLGSLLVEAVLKRDYPVVEAATFFAASGSLLGTLLGDWAQKWVDPR